jgi:dipeptidyl aminopeptidase/acylaminoacyl peptidase
LNIKLALALCLAGYATIAREPAVPLPVYGRMPFLEDVTLSPDGSRLALIRTKGDSRNLLIVPVAGEMKLLAGAKIGNAKVRHIQWQDNDNVLVTVSSTSAPPPGFYGADQEWYRLIHLNVPSGKQRLIDFETPGVETFNVVLGVPQVRELDGKAVTFAQGLWVTSAGVLPALFSFTDGREVKLLTQGNKSRMDWLIDANGKIASELGYDTDTRVWTLRTREGTNNLETVANGKADIDAPELMGFTPKGDGVVVGFTEATGAVWRPVSLQSGKLGEAFDSGNELHQVIADERSNRIIGGVHHSDGNVVFFDKGVQSHWDAMLVDFPGERVRLVSHSSDFQRLLVSVFGARDGYQYAMYDWRVRIPMMLGQIYQGLSETASVEEISYKAADGLTIPAILTVPREVSRKNLPLIVFPHGGPEAEDTDEFDWWAQAMAVQGYAVLQPNYRGSSLNHEFVEAGYGQWGRKMQTDLSDGVTFLANEGIVDAKRVCIVGASYGGYAALAGVTLQSDIYRCAVSVAGVADLVRMRNWTRRTEASVSTRYWDRFWGVTEHDDTALRMISPIEHLPSGPVPLLLVHGKDDTVVPYEQSEKMAAALRKAGKPVEFVTLSHEDHWLSRGETRAQMLEATVAFLRRNNPPD